MKRTLTIKCTQDLDDRTPFNEHFLPALVDYYCALEAGTVGRLSNEIFVASNGVTFRIRHRLPLIDRARRLWWRVAGKVPGSRSTEVTIVWPVQ